MSPEPSTIRVVAIAARQESREASRTAAELTEWLVRRGIEVALDSDTLRSRNLRDVAVFEPSKRYDLVIVLGGAVLTLLAAIGVVRFPDALTRMHALTKASTVGFGLIAIGSCLNMTNANDITSVLLAAGLQLLTLPVAATLKVAEAGATTVVDAGCVVMLGSTLTVNVPIALVTLPATFETTTEYCAPLSAAAFVGESV